MRVLFDLSSPRQAPLLVGMPDCVFVVRHSWWIFVWDKTYLRIKLGNQLWQWQDENGKAPKIRVAEFLEKTMRERYA